MKNSIRSPALLTSLLLLLMLAIITQIGAASPTFAQIGVQSTTHPTGPRTSTTTSLSSSTNTTSGHGRPGGVPPGLLNAWAHSNMSVVARAVTHAIFVNGTHGVELAEIAINASSNGQMIRDVAFNESVVQIGFDHDGAVELSANSSVKPTAVFADDRELPESQSSAGLNQNSNAWVYDQNT